MGSSAWTPVEETPSAASAWTPVEEPKAASAPAQREAGPMERFATRALHLQDDFFQRPGAYLNPFSKEYWDKGKQEQEAQKAAPPPTASLVPEFAKQTAADLQSGNFAGAAGDVIGPAAQIASVVRPILHGPAGPPSRIGQTVKAVAAPVGKMAMGMAEDIPVVRGALKGAKTFQDVPGQLRDIWSSATPEAKADLTAKVQQQNAAVADLHQQLTDALAKFKDVPDLRVQPGQQAPQNLLEARKAAFMAAQRGAQGEFQVAPPEGAASEPSAVIRNVQGQPTTGAQPNPQGVNPAILRATGQAPSTGRITPNMEIYNEAMQPPPPVKPPTLLEQLRQWDQIRQIHSQLEDQIGKGQDEIQQWMEDHNQQAPGAKKPSAAATAKARFDAARAKAVPGTADEPRVPTSDSDMEELLVKSVQAAKAKKAMAAKAGD